MRIGPDGPTSPARQRLLGLEAGRFLAALLVACFHYTLAFRNIRDVTIFDMAFRGGHAGVEYFFVLSGFIIYWVHAGDIGRPGQLRPFLIKRFIRLYPMFWLVTALMLAMFLVPSSVSSHRSLSGPGLLLDALLLPTGGSMIIEPSWSLRHEIVFYAVFALAICNARAGLVALVVWQASALAVGLAYPNTLPPAWMPLFYLYNIGFGVGLAVAWLTSRHAISRPGLLASVGSAMFVACLIVEWRLGRDIPVPALPLGEVLSPLLYITASAIIILGMTQLEMRHAFPGQSLLRLLGGSSYVLYLVHGIVGSIVIRLFDISILSRVPGSLVFAAMVIAAVTVSLALHVLVERPLLRALRGSLLSKAWGAQQSRDGIGPERHRGVEA